MATTDHFPANFSHTSSSPTPRASRSSQIARIFLVNILIIFIICLILSVSIIFASGEEETTSERPNEDFRALKGSEKMLLPVKIDKLRVKIFTWNLGGSNGYKDITLQSLGLVGRYNEAKELPHILAFGFQEAPQYALSDPIIIFLKNLLNNDDMKYTKVGNEVLGSMMLVVFARFDLFHQIRNIETSWVPTGLFNLVGNKGAVGLRFSLPHDHLHICIVNAHLAAHDEYLDRRIDDYNRILSRMTFKTPQFGDVLSHNEIFFLGDLNFRISQISAEDILEDIRLGSTENRQRLVAHDQLKQVQSAGRAFVCFNEPQINFWPTFKFKTGQEDVYDLKRKPSYTDRILYKGFTSSGINSRSNQPIARHGTKEIEYKSINSFTSSDHKPVTALFSIDPSFSVRRSDEETDSSFVFHVRGTLSEPEPVLGFAGIFVTFDYIPAWKNETDNLVSLSFHDYDGNYMQRDFVDSFDRAWDWVGVYPANFTDVDNWICYSYAQYATVKDATPEIPHTHLQLKMNCLLPVGSSYRLIYFHEVESKSILGVSNSFVVANE